MNERLCSPLHTLDRQTEALAVSVNESISAALQNVSRVTFLLFVQGVTLQLVSVVCFPVQFPVRSCKLHCRANKNT